MFYTIFCSSLCSIIFFIEECPSYILQCIYIVLYLVCVVCFPLRRMLLCLMTMARTWPVYRHYRESMKDLKYACCVPTCSYIMHAIIVKESPIRNVLYGKWLEVIRINQVPQLLLSNSHPPLTPACSDWSPKATFAIYFFILNSCSVI